MLIRKEVYKVLMVTRGVKSGIGRYFNILLVSTIILNTVAIILHTVKSMRHEFDAFYRLRIFLCRIFYH